MDLANFLAFLSSSKGLSASTVCVHCAAISSTLRQLGGPSFSDDPLLRALVRGASLSHACKSLRIPLWDLFLVLQYLRKAPFEHLAIAPFMLLSMKTLFLISLASGRRCSEVHALSGITQDIAFESDGSISFRFLPEFLAKNQTPSTPSPILFIKPLSSILAHDYEDRFLCTVRALCVNLKRSHPFRSSKRRLFISWNLDHPRDISKTSLSRCIVSAIKGVYADTGLRLDASSARAHEVRAWSSSLALAHSARLQDIMDAAYWKNPATFNDFYLRDVARLWDDGSRGIASVVVAQ
ncbi:uncharacterized protein LOC143292702 [Babylonia areolata]|uniref:uncharacterized protein LOC143292702 n=1 Tax=Babylonia areolata TaxID=304850 RepID=UPI003FD0AD1E